VNDTSANDANKPSPVEGPTPTEPTIEIPSGQEFAALRQERDLLEQQLQRALADTANMRRRQQKETDDNRRRVIEGMTQELLPVLDTFTMALTAYETGSDAKALIEGVRMTRTLLVGALERHGLQEIVAAGAAFDPSKHQAVAVEPADNVPAGQILRVLQAGYQLGEYVVRHSRVVVAGKAQDPPPST
jgi:molecular chaperone GrpE